MKIDITPRDDHQITMVLELEQDQMAGAKRRAARRMSEKKSIPGFRPGKAPYDVIVRTFGEDAIVESAVDILLDEIYPEAIKETQIEPAAPGSLEKIDGLDSKPIFTFTIPLAPTVDLGDFRSIRIPYSWKEPGQDKLDTALEDMRKMYAKTETVSRPVQLGDFVLIDIKGVNPKADPGEIPGLERTDFPIFVQGDKKVDEWPFPGFYEKLITMNVGEEKIITHKYPQDASDENLRGNAIQFNVRVKMVRGTSLPELNDEFAKSVGPFTDLQALKDALKANLSAQSKAEYDDQYFNDLIEKIKAGAKIAYAPHTIDHEVEHVIEDIKSRLAAQNMDLPSYLNTRKMEETEFITKEVRPVALKKLERALIMEEIARQEKIELDKTMLEQFFQQTWGELQSDQTFQKSMKKKAQPSQQLINAVARESANRAYVQQTLERIKNIASGKVETIETKKPVDIGEVKSSPRKKIKRETAQKKSKEDQ